MLTDNTLPLNAILLPTFSYYLCFHFSQHQHATFSLWWTLKFMQEGSENKKRHTQRISLLVYGRWKAKTKKLLVNSSSGDPGLWEPAPDSGDPAPPLVRSCSARLPRSGNAWKEPSGRDPPPPSLRPAVQVPPEPLAGAGGLWSGWGQLPNSVLRTCSRLLDTIAPELFRPLLSGKADLHNPGPRSLKGGMLAPLSLLKVPSEGSQSAIWL